MKLFYILTLILLLKLRITWGIPEISDKIIASVNNNIILYSDFLKKINILKIDTNNTNSPNLYSLHNKDLYNKILNQLIVDNLITQISTQENIKINHDQINHIIDQIAYSRNITKQQFITLLNNYNLNYEQYYTEINQEILNKLISNHFIYQNINIPTHDISEIAQKINFINFNKQFKLTHIIIELPIQPLLSQTNNAHELAKLMIKKIQSKKNIKNLICEYYNSSIFPRMTIEKTSWISWKNIPTIFDQHLQTAKPGSIIGPIHAYDGIHILEIHDISFKECVFPIIRIQADIILSKDTSSTINIEQKLLEVKKQLEDHDTTFDSFIKEKTHDFNIENYVTPSTWIDLDNFDVSIQKTLLSLKKNQISMPILTTQGWCILKLIDITKLNYSEIIRERAYSYLVYQNFNDALNKWIEKLKNESYIKIIN